MSHYKEIHMHFTCILHMNIETTNLMNSTVIGDITKWQSVL